MRGSGFTAALCASRPVCEPDCPLSKGSLRILKNYGGKKYLSV